MATIIFLFFCWLIIRACKAFFRALTHRRRKPVKRRKTEYGPVSSPSTLTDPKQAEKERRNALKVAQARIDMEYYGGVLETQTDLIAAYTSEKNEIMQQLETQKLAYEMSENPALFVDMYVSGFNTSKATKQVEQLTAKIQTAQGKAAAARKKIQTAQLVIEMYN